MHSNHHTGKQQREKRMKPSKKRSFFSFSPASGRQKMASYSLCFALLLAQGCYPVAPNVSCTLFSSHFLPMLCVRSAYLSGRNGTLLDLRPYPVHHNRSKTKKKNKRSKKTNRLLKLVIYKTFPNRNTLRAAANYTALSLNISPSTHAILFEPCLRIARGLLVQHHRDGQPVACRAGSPCGDERDGTEWKLGRICP